MIKNVLQYKILLLICLLLASTVAYSQDPTVTSTVPVNSATNINENDDIVINFSELVRETNNTDLTDLTVDGYITLKLTNSAGADIAFDAIINDPTNTQITINPTLALPSGAIIYVAVADLEDGTNNLLNPSPTSFTFTVRDYVAPSITFTPTDATINVAVNSDIVIDFSEPIRLTNDNPITPTDIEGGLVELKLDNDAGASVLFTATITGGNQITINPTSDLSTDQVYYVEMNIVEDANNNATTAESITFTTIETEPPVPTFTPTDGATGVLESANITITFNEAIRNIDDSPISAGDLNTLVELKLTDNNGSTVPFSASIDGTNTIITINPTSNLAGSTVYYVEINPVEDALNNALTATSITFTTGNTLPPDITFNPDNGAVDVPVASNLIITFSEPVRKLDDSPITPADLATLVELKLTNDAGAGVPFTASIDGTNTIITVNPDGNFSSSTLYYLEINPVEDAGDIATIATSITFTSADILPPNITFNPTAGAIDVVESTNIVLTFDESIRRASDDANLDDTNVDARITLKITDATGANIPFDATINGSDDVITINPTLNLPSGTVIYVAITGVEDLSGNLISPNPTFITFTTDDTVAPTISSTVPADNAIGVSVKLTQFTITFSEPVAYVGDNSDDANRIRIWDDDANAFVETINVIDVSVMGNVVTFTTDFAFDDFTNYDVIIGNSVFEDLAGNPFGGLIEDDWGFRTEAAPSISSLSNTTRCIADQLTINGSRFTGTGGSGNTKPFVFINGVQVPDVNITAFTSTTITLTVPSGVSTGDVTVENRDNFLVSNGSALTVHPQINLGLTVTPETTSPAQNTNVDVVITSAQNNYDYALTLTDAPASFIAEHTLTLPDIAEEATGTGSNLTLNTSEGTDPDFTQIGSYTYQIDVTRTGCTPRTLNTILVLTVASLDVTVSATSTSVCEGSSTVLIGSTSGGTGFYQFSWIGPNGFVSNSSSPSISPAHPAGTGWYILTLSDNSANTDKDSVYITTNAVPTASIDPEPGQTFVRTDYTPENTDFRLYGSPTGVGGVFSGQGVKLKNDGFYYFNPSDAGIGTWQIVFTFTNASGCSDQDTETFRVNNTAVNGLAQSYCTVINSDNNLAYNPATFPSPSYQFTRLVFYVSGCIAEPAPSFSNCASFNPLTVNSTQSVPDIQAGVTLPIGTMFNQPVSYTLDIQGIRSNYGYSTTNSFYILVYGKNSSGVEVYINAQFFRVVENGPVPSIVGINENENVCQDADPINLTQSINGYFINSFTITNPYEPSLSGDEFDPSDNSLTGADERALTISMSYNDFNGCQSSTTRNFFWIKKPNAPITADTSFCQFGDPTTFAITATANGPSNNPFWYDLDPGNPTATVLDSLNFTLNLSSEINGQTPTTQTYYVLQQYKGCKGNFTDVDIEIKPAPNATFTPPAICQSREFTLNGPLDALNSNLPYATYEWSFDDGRIAQRFNSDTITHTYNVATNFDIALTVTSSQGCKNNSFVPVTVGLNPVPDFTWQQVCAGDNTVFSATTNIEVDDFEWYFPDDTLVRAPKANAAPEGGTMQQPVHQITLAPQTYDVTVVSYTSTGCFNATTKPVTILPYLPYTTDTPYIMQDEDGGQGFITVEDINGNSTWEFAVPSTPILSKLGTSSWVTNATGNYLPGEKAYLNTPCFDISGVARPVMTVSFAMDTQEQGDGVVVEYSKNGGVNWVALGNTATGANWFNTSNFFSGTIGSSTVGWSGDSRDLSDNILRDTVVEGRRALDNLANLSIADRQKVRFRFVFQSNGDREQEGFGFNNLKIESRNRTLLVENFTNEGDPDYASNTSSFNGISPLESVKIQYHVPFPNEDDNSRISAADQSARAAFYGVTLTNAGIPRAYIDGVSGGDFGPWSVTRFDNRSLVSANFNITVASQDTTAAGYLKALVTMEALQNIPLVGKPVLHIAAVEKSDGTTNNDFVLRKFFGSPTGIPLENFISFPIPQGTIETYTHRVYLDDPRINYDSLALVAFIQDEITKEVYQATIELKPDFLPDGDLITGVEDPTYANKINLFPNPANQEVNIELPAAVTRNTPVLMFDTYGRAVFESSFAPGERAKKVDTTELAGGMYIIQISTPEGNVARKKIMVVHR